jgi:hypothetical protein
MSGKSGSALAVDGGSVAYEPSTVGAELAYGGIGEAKVGCCDGVEVAVTMVGGGTFADAGRP